MREHFRRSSALLRPEGATMARGDKSSYSSRQKRKAAHIEKGYERRGVSKKTAQKRAWATVNKQEGGGARKKSSTRKKAASKKSGGRKTAHRKSSAKKTSGKTPRRKTSRRKTTRKTSRSRR
jgi:hypothetical protein